VLHIVRRSICVAADIGIAVSKTCLDNFARGAVETPESAREMAEPENRVPSNVEMRV